MKQIISDLYQFTTHIKPIDFSINQYLLASIQPYYLLLGLKLWLLIIYQKLNRF